MPNFPWQSVKHPTPLKKEHKLVKHTSLKKEHTTNTGFTKDAQGKREKILC